MTYHLTAVTKGAIGFAYVGGIAFFLARRHDGTRRFSYSHVGSIIGAALISRSWQPHSSRGMRAAALNARMPEAPGMSLTTNG